MKDFVAIDFEAANRDRRSACAIGLVQVSQGELGRRFESYIKPKSEFSKFDPFNVLIHGITNHTVQNSPSFEEIWLQIRNINFGFDTPLVCHNAGYDVKVLRDLLNLYEITTDEIYFYDTLLLSKFVWPHLASYKLSVICKFLNIPLDHHVAISDAEACAEIALKHMEIIGVTSLAEVANHFGLKLGKISSNLLSNRNLNLNYVIDNQYSRADLSFQSKGQNLNDEKKYNFYQDLNGKNIVFTGELSSMNRKSATLIAVKNGANVNSSITSKTNILVVGIDDFKNYSQGKKSRKLLDAEKLLNLGNKIDIIDEEDFIRLLSD
jgi:DNA polymerase-3 subunit epsilon